MDDQNKNLILATALSFLVVVVWIWLNPIEEPQPPADTVASETTAEGAVPTVTADAPATSTATAPPAETIIEAPRVAIKTPEFDGSISLRGGRIDDLSLTQYRETQDADAETVTLFRPIGEADAYFTLFGWAGLEGITAIPGPDTIWSLESGETLTPDSPVTLVWDNGAGQIFRNEISVDDSFMFTFAQSVENMGGTIRARPYGLLQRNGEPSDLKNFFILHEGLVRMSDGELQEVDYDEMVDYPVVATENTKAERIEVAENGWIGFTDHYWMTTLIPEQGQPFASVASYFKDEKIYWSVAKLPVQTVATGETATVTTQVFAGAKEWEAIRHYQNEQGVEGFLDSIDWGWFFFMTKPIFWLLHNINILIGNMGWSIICLTLIIKALVLPLAYKSYVSMAKMKELQPEMEKLKESAGDDKQAMQQGMMKLYKDNKVNPASGCLPILLQIPIFFSLYKVIFVTIELRHAPWLGWITDLSAPDPSSILNLFGLLPWSVPEVGSIFFIFSLGILPIILGISMWLQQKLNPAPTDPTQKMIFAWMPWVFMFMLGSFASGLVLYWIANNTITFVQQYLIMRSHGSKPDLFGNITSSFKRSPKTAAANEDKKPKGKK